jgi:hypothetical protein
VKPVIFALALLFILSGSAVAGSRDAERSGPVCDQQGESTGLIEFIEDVASTLVDWLTDRLPDSGDGEDCDPSPPVNDEGPGVTTPHKAITADDGWTEIV